MAYYFSKILSLPFEEAVQKTILALQEAGFGILTDINVQKTLRQKLKVDFPPYRILGACNPPLAFKALSTENKIGTMLPCNVIVREQDGATEVAAVDPVASMQAIQNPQLKEVAEEVRKKLQQVVAGLG